MNRHEWPSHAPYAARFRVEDLIPAVPSGKPLKAVFIGESPHRDEVASEEADRRTPFRGVAGREWWKELARINSEMNGKLLETKPVPSRPVLLELCRELGIGVMNAVQFPIDPKIVQHQGDYSTPLAHLGFEKATGFGSYKAIFKQSGDEGPVGLAIRDLANRLRALQDQSLQIVCLGNDSRWFVDRAVILLPEDAAIRRLPILPVPHPSSWWRNELYRRRAVDALEGLLGTNAAEPGGLAPFTARNARDGQAAHHFASLL